jgi:hypothetical protein
MQPTEKNTSCDSRQPEWRELYQRALLELDIEKLRELIVAAEKAISDCLQTIGEDSNHHAERRDIADALSSLRALKRNWR